MELSVLSYDLHLQMESALSGTRTIVKIFFLSTFCSWWFEELTIIKLYILMALKYYLNIVLFLFPSSMFDQQVISCHLSKLPEMWNNRRSLHVSRYFFVTWHLSNCPDGAPSLYEYSVVCSPSPIRPSHGTTLPPPLPSHCPSNLLSVHNLCCLLRC